MIAILKAKSRKLAMLIRADTGCSCVYLNLLLENCRRFDNRIHNRILFNTYVGNDQSSIWRVEKYLVEAIVMLFRSIKLNFVAKDCPVIER